MSDDFELPVLPAVAAEDNPLESGWLVVPQAASVIPGFSFGPGRVGIFRFDRPSENPGDFVLSPKPVWRDHRRLPSVSFRYWLRLGH